MLATYVDDIERLTGIGLGPFIALLVVAIVVLGGGIVSIFFFFWRQLGKAWKKRDEERKLRDEERAKWHADVEDRLKASEKKHEECERDRGELKTDMSSVKLELQRMRQCPRKDCPMQLSS